jgi:hypothetical protein
MKLRITATTLLLAAMTGTSLSYADDLLTDSVPGQSEDVPVIISGKIVADDNVPGCTAASSSGLVLNMGNNDGALEWTKTGERFTLGQVFAGDINITCDPGTTTNITFKTNNDFIEDASQGAQYDSWAVIIVPDPLFDGTPANLSEAVINGYLTDVACIGGTCDEHTTGNLSKSKITAENASGTTSQEITAGISGQLFTKAIVYGEVQPSPRVPNPELYVIYEGKSTSAIPLNVTEPDQS